MNPTYVSEKDPSEIREAWILEIALTQEMPRAI